MKRARYEELEVTLHGGDCLLLMSDGFPELENEEGELYGYARVHSLLLSLAGESCQRVIERLAGEVEGWSGGRPPRDDVTFVAVRVA